MTASPRSNGPRLHPLGMFRPLFVSALLSLALLAGCDSAESLRIEDTRSRLVGTWLREPDADSVPSRRLLVLGAEGKFTERIVVSPQGSPAGRRELAGEWSYDGTNLKRRYLQENGRQFAGGSMRFATFPLLSVGRAELVVDDKIEGRPVTYRRVPEGTLP
jgi:hypothetical protein